MNAVTMEKFYKKCKDEGESSSELSTKIMNILLTEHIDEEDVNLVQFYLALTKSLSSVLVMMAADIESAKTLKNEVVRMLDIVVAEYFKPKEGKM